MSDSYRQAKEWVSYHVMADQTEVVSSMLKLVADGVVDQYEDFPFDKDMLESVFHCSKVYKDDDGNELDLEIIEERILDLDLQVMDMIDHVEKAEAEVDPEDPLSERKLELLKHRLRELEVKKTQWEVYKDSPENREVKQWLLVDHVAADQLKQAGALVIEHADSAWWGRFDILNPARSKEVDTVCQLRRT